jgi:hypothetical protein
MAMPKLWQRKPGRPARHRRTTAISFSADDLTALGRLVATGQAVLQEKPPVVARLKAAMTRLQVGVPKGL